MVKRAQVLLEYLLLLGLVAVIALTAFRSGGIIDQTVQTSNEYYKTGAAAILGGHYDNEGKSVVMENPVAVDGGWCEASRCVNGFQARECACPRKSFGGKECAGKAVVSCTEGPSGTYTEVDPCPGGCPGGKICSGSGCVCPAGTIDCAGVCTAIGTDTDCSACGMMCVSPKHCINGSCQNPSSVCDNSCSDPSEVACGARYNNSCGKRECEGSKDTCAPNFDCKQETGKWECTCVPLCKKESVACGVDAGDGCGGSCIGTYCESSYDTCSGALGAVCTPPVCTPENDACNTESVECGVSFEDGCKKPCPKKGTSCSAWLEKPGNTGKTAKCVEELAPNTDSFFCCDLDDTEGTPLSQIPCGEDRSEYTENGENIRTDCGVIAPAGTGTLCSDETKPLCIPKIKKCCVAAAGASCSSSPNSCDQTSSGTVDCEGNCQATTPANPPGLGESCTVTNDCGMQGTGTITCNETCSAIPPINPDCLESTVCRGSILRVFNGSCEKGNCIYIDTDCGVKGCNAVTGACNP